MKYTLKSKLFDILLIDAVGAVTFMVLFNIFGKIVPNIISYLPIAIFVVVAFVIKENIQILKSKKL